MSKKLILLMTSFFSYCSALHVHHTPKEFTTNQTVGFSLGIMRLLFGMEQLLSEKRIIKAVAALKKTQALVKKEHEKQSTESVPVDLVDERVAQRVKRVSKLLDLHGGTQGAESTFSAVEEAVAVRNNMPERAMGVMGSLLPIGVMPCHRIGKHLFLRTTLLLLDSLLSFARHARYKNVKEMMWLTAAQRTARLLRMVLTFGVRKVNVHVLGAYAIQLLNVGASFFGSPRENMLPNFNWRGDIKNFEVKRAVNDYQGYLHEQLTDPTISSDRRAHMMANMKNIVTDAGRAQFKQVFYEQRYLPWLVSQIKMIPPERLDGDKLNEVLLQLGEFASSLEQERDEAIAFNLKAEQIKGYDPSPGKPVVSEKAIALSRFAKRLTKEARDDNCVVCQEKMSDVTQLAYLTCKHLFCRDCLGQALQHNKACPTCREPAQLVTYPAATQPKKKTTLFDSLSAKSLFAQYKNTEVAPKGAIPLDYTVSEKSQREAINEIQAAFSSGS